MVKQCFLRFAIACSAAFLAVTSADSQSSNLALIDQELSGQIDFRTIDYRVCVSQYKCTVNGMTLVAERRSDLDESWLPAEIYWDPIDGIGIKDGAQNDEIDFDERLQVLFENRTAIQKIWFSDLFLGEDHRYGSSHTNLVVGVPENVEIAAVGLIVDDAEVSTFNVWGNQTLPIHPFDYHISSLFAEKGDLRRRIVINGDIITVVAPDLGSNSGDITLRIPLGEIDPEKLSIFEGVETVEIDLIQILAEFHNAPLFSSGTANFDRINSMLQDTDGLEELRLEAVRERSVSSWSNGELYQIAQILTRVLRVSLWVCL